MSSSLSNSVDLLTDSRFIARVAVAVTEAAASIPADRGDFLARRVIADVDSVARVFARLVADDSVVSGRAAAAEVSDTDIRRVVASTWDGVSVSLPNLT